MPVTKININKSLYNVYVLYMISHVAKIRYGPKYTMLHTPSSYYCLFSRTKLS